MTILIENRVRRRGLFAEHGLSLWIEFDAGQSTHTGKVLYMGIDLSLADRLVLSHGHDDHGNDFRRFPADSKKWPRFYAHPDAFQPRYEHHHGTLKRLAFP